ncbi:hypothetical protein GF356_06125 [candidate division GN15 bacterium]|nr:hypothetical protein [candidate division GN15 bacterium]
MRHPRSLAFLMAALLVMAVGNAQAGGLFDWGKDRIEGSGNIVTQSRDLPDFDCIKHTGSTDLHITIGDEQSVEVIFDDNLVDVIETEVDGGTLYIGSKRDISYSASLSCRIEITTNDIKAVRLAGSGDVVVENLNGGSFAYDLAGSGDLILRGAVEELEVNVRGSGDVNARDLSARDASVRIMGSGDVSVWATENFDGSVYGSGDIRYYGDPKHTSTHVAGSGEIRKR